MSKLEVITHIEGYDIWERLLKLRQDKTFKEKRTFFLMNPDLAFIELISEAHGKSLNIRAAVDTGISYETYNRIKNYTPYNGIESLELFSIPQVPSNLNDRDAAMLISGFKTQGNRVLILLSDMEKLTFYLNFFYGEVILFLIREEEVFDNTEKWVEVDTEKNFTHII